MSDKRKISDSDIGTTIAERHFEAKNKAGEEHEIIIRFGIPVQDPQSGGDWLCPYQIMGIPNEGVSTAFGIDSLQAFILALVKVRAELAFSQRAYGLRLTWLEMDNWGLPESETKFEQ